MTDPLSADLAQTLASLHRAGKIASPWLPGMLTTDGDRVIEVTGDAVRYAGDDEFYVPGLGDQAGLPDPTDDATRGCLLALVREAHGDLSISTIAVQRHGGALGWGVQSEPDRPECIAWDEDTEAHALLAALRAALPTEPTP